MGNSSGGDGDSGHVTWSPKKVQAYDDYTRSFQSGGENFLKTELDRASWAKLPTKMIDVGSPLTFAKGVDTGALQALYEKNPRHEIFDQSSYSGAARRLSGNDGISSDQYGNVDPVGSQALYLAGNPTSAYSKAFQDAQESSNGAAANKNRAISPLANGSGTSPSTPIPAGAKITQGASQPGSILGSTDSSTSTIKTLLGL